MCCSWRYIHIYTLDALPTSHLRVDSLSIGPHHDCDIDFTASLSVTVHEVNAGSEASSVPASFGIVVEAICDGSALEAPDSLVIFEDSSDNITSFWVDSDSDGSEVVTALSVAGVQGAQVQVAGDFHTVESENLVLDPPQSIIIDASWDGQIGIYLLPQCDAGFDLSARVSSVESNGLDSCEGAIKETAVTITAVTDEPTLAVENNIGLEDKRIPVLLTPFLGADTDLSEAFRSIVLSSFPSSAVLVAGSGWAVTNTENTEFKLTDTDGVYLADSVSVPLLSVRAASQCDIDFTLSATVSAAEAGNSYEDAATSLLHPFGLGVRGVCDDPELSLVSDTNAMEDAQLVIPVTPMYGADTDLSEVLSTFYAWGGLPGSTFVPQGSVAVSPRASENDPDVITATIGGFTPQEELESLVLQLSQQCDADFTLSVSLRSSELNEGSVASSSNSSVGVVVSPVTDSPTWAALASTETDEDVSVMMAWTPFLSDTDYSERLVFLDTTISDAAAGVFFLDLPEEAQVVCGSDGIPGECTVEHTGSGFDSGASVRASVVPPDQRSADLVMGFTVTAIEEGIGDGQLPDPAFATSAIRYTTFDVLAVPDETQAEVVTESALWENETITIAVTPAYGADTDGSERFERVVCSVNDTLLQLQVEDDPAVLVSEDAIPGMQAWTIASLETLGFTPETLLPMISVFPSLHCDTDFNITYSLVSYDCDEDVSLCSEGDTFHHTVPLPYIVSPVVSEVWVASSVPGLGGEPLQAGESGRLLVTPFFEDTDGSETVRFVIVDGVPSDAAFSELGDGFVEIRFEDRYIIESIDDTVLSSGVVVPGLSLTVPSDADTDFYLTISIVVEETNGELAESPVVETLVSVDSDLPIVTIAYIETSMRLESDDAEDVLYSNLVDGLAALFQTSEEVIDIAEMSYSAGLAELAARSIWQGRSMTSTEVSVLTRVYMDDDDMDAAVNGFNQLSLDEISDILGYSVLEATAVVKEESDVNECEMDVCSSSPTLTCMNTRGSYKCVCSANWEYVNEDDPSLGCVPSDTDEDDGGGGGAVLSDSNVVAVAVGSFCGLAVLIALYVWRKPVMRKVLRERADKTTVDILGVGSDDAYTPGKPSADPSSAVDSGFPAGQLQNSQEEIINALLEGAESGKKGSAVVEVLQLSSMDPRFRNLVVVAAASELTTRFAGILEAATDDAPTSTFRAHRSKHLRIACRCGGMALLLDEAASAVKGSEDPSVLGIFNEAIEAYLALMVDIRALMLLWEPPLRLTDSGGIDRQDVLELFEKLLGRMRKRGPYDDQYADCQIRLRGVIDTILDEVATNLPVSLDNIEENLGIGAVQVGISGRWNHWDEEDERDSEKDESGVRTFVSRTVREATLADPKKVEDLCETYQAEFRELMRVGQAIHDSETLDRLPKTLTERVVLRSRRYMSDTVSEVRRSLLSETNLRTLAYDELTLDSKIGDGSFGEVYKASFQGITVAVKVWKARRHTRRESYYFLREGSLVSSISAHPNLIKYWGLCVDHPLCFVMEYAARGSLRDFLDSHAPESQGSQAGKPTWSVSSSVELIKGVLRGLAFLHSHNPPIVHRNLHSRNLLVIGNQLRISDMGGGTEDFLLTPSMADVIPWLAPEVLTHSGVGPKSDIYSIGIILWEMTCAFEFGLNPREPYESHCPDSDSLIRAITEDDRRPPVIPQVDVELADLMGRCWVSPMEDRPSADAILEFLNGWRPEGDSEKIDRMEAAYVYRGVIERCLEKHAVSWDDRRRMTVLSAGATASQTQALLENTLPLRPPGGMRDWPLTPITDVMHNHHLCCIGCSPKFWATEVDRDRSELVLQWLERANVGSVLPAMQALGIYDLETAKGLSSRDIDVYFSHLDAPTKEGLRTALSLLHEAANISDSPSMKPKPPPQTMTMSQPPQRPTQAVPPSPEYKSGGDMGYGSPHTAEAEADCPVGGNHAMTDNSHLNGANESSGSARAEANGICSVNSDVGDALSIDDLRLDASEGYGAAGADRVPNGPSQKLLGEMEWDENGLANDAGVYQNGDGEGSSDSNHSVDGGRPRTKSGLSHSLEGVMQEFSPRPVLVSYGSKHGWKKDLGKHEGNLSDVSTSSPSSVLSSSSSPRSDLPSVI
eukprot:Rmarinus@m.10421